MSGMALKLPHKHRYETQFTRQKGAINYDECACGDRRTRAKSSAKMERPLPGWPDPFAKQRRSARKDRDPRNGSKNLWNTTF